MNWSIQAADPGKLVRANKLHNFLYTLVVYKFMKFIKCYDRLFMSVNTIIIVTIKFCCILGWPDWPTTFFRGETFRAVEMLTTPFPYPQTPYPNNPLKLKKPPRRSDSASVPHISSSSRPFPLQMPLCPGQVEIAPTTPP